MNNNNSNNSSNMSSAVWPAVTISTITTNNNPSTSSKYTFLYTPTRSTTATICWLLIKVMWFFKRGDLIRFAFYLACDWSRPHKYNSPPSGIQSRAFEIRCCLEHFIQHHAFYKASLTHAGAHTHTLFIALRFFLWHYLSYPRPYLILFLYISWAWYGEEEMKRIVLDLTVSDGEEFCRGALWIECHLMLS